MKRDLNLDCLKSVGRFAVYLSIWGLVSASAIAKKNARVLFDSMPETNTKNRRWLMAKLDMKPTIFQSAAFWRKYA